MLTIQTPAARATDPETSYAAQSYIDKSGIRSLQQRWVAKAVAKWPGCTSYELAVKMGRERVVTARRLPELVTAGVVEKGPHRKCTITGRTAQTWFPINQSGAEAA